ncbi:MAG: SDR family oxidoreductase [Candidatus Dormibacteraceae bacterium]
MPSVLVTGANRGLGLEFARQFAAERWEVFAACRDPQQAETLVELAKSAAVRTVQMDVTAARSVRRAASAVGNATIDVLINSAGIMGKRQRAAEEMDYESWMEVLNVNTLGPLRVAEAFLDRVAASKRKLIVTITSGMGSLADNQSGGHIPYRSSKAAVNMVMRSLAVDLRPRGITCIVVNPGWVRTDMGGAGAPLTPAESVSALRRLIAKVGPRDTGKFFDYTGRKYPW